MTVFCLSLLDDDLLHPLRPLADRGLALESGTDFDFLLEVLTTHWRAIRDSRYTKSRLPGFLPGNFCRLLKAPFDRIAKINVQFFP